MSQLKATMNNPSLSDEDKHIASIVLQDKLNQLEITRHNYVRDHLAAKIWLKNESLASKFWAKSGNEQKPCDTIVKLRSLDTPPNSPVHYEQRLDKMAKLARKYYDSLQNKGVAPQDKHNNGSALNNQ